MALRVGIVDITAAGVALVAILLPAPPRKVTPLYAQLPPQVARDIAAAQAQLARDPQDGRAAAELVEALMAAGQSDWALRVGGATAERIEGGDKWRAYLAVSGVHATLRLEIKEAHEYAEKALSACERAGDACPGYEKVRLGIYADQLEAGLQSGIDPRVDPRGFRAAIDRAFPKTRFRAPAPEPDGPEDRR